MLAMTCAYQIQVTKFLSTTNLDSHLDSNCDVTNEAYLTNKK